MLTLTIGPHTYGLEFLGGTARLTRHDGTVYQIEATTDPARSCRCGLACTCPDFQYRHAGLPTAGCKHCRSLAEAGLLPLVNLPLAITED